MASITNAEWRAQHYKWLFAVALGALGALVGLIYENQRSYIMRIDNLLAAHIEKHDQLRQEYDALKDAVIRLQVQRRRFPDAESDPLFGGSIGQ